MLFSQIISLVDKVICQSKSISINIELNLPGMFLSPIFLLKTCKQHVLWKDKKLKSRSKTNQ